MIEGFKHLTTCPKKTPLFFWSRVSQLRAMQMMIRQFHSRDMRISVCVRVCVCVWETEREREWEREFFREPDAAMYDGNQFQYNSGGWRQWKVQAACIHAFKPFFRSLFWQKNSIWETILETSRKFQDSCRTTSSPMRLKLRFLILCVLGFIFKYYFCNFVETVSDSVK